MMPLADRPEDSAGLVNARTNPLVMRPAIAQLLGVWLQPGSSAINAVPSSTDLGAAAFLGVIVFRFGSDLRDLDLAINQGF